MKPLRLGIVGAGLIWNNRHKAIVQELWQRFQIAAFCVRSDATRARLRTEFPYTTQYEDYDDLARAKDIDVVVALTPIKLNAPVATAMLAAGKHVLLEKPMASSVAEGQALVRAAADSRATLYIMEQLPYHPAVPVMRAAIGDGRIGTPVAFERSSFQFIATTDDTSGGYGGTAWRVQPEFPIGMVFDGGIHDLALFRTMFGPPRAVYAHGANLRPEFGEYDWVACVIEYDNRVTGTYTHSAYLGGIQNAFIVRGVDGLLRLDDNGLVLQKKVTANAEPFSMTLALPPLSDYQAMWRHFADCLHSGGRQPGYGAEDALYELRLLEAMQRSLAERRRIAIARPL